MAKRRAKGEGSIYYSSNDGRWKAQITLPNGERRGKSAKSQKEVRDWLIDQRKKAKEGLYVIDDRIRLGDFLQRYIEDVAAHSLRPSSLVRYAQIVKKHIAPELGNIKLNALRPDQVQRFYTKKLNEGLSPRSVQHIHAVLHKALNQAMKWGMVMRNVSDLVEKPKPRKKSFKTWSADEVNRFLDAVSHHYRYPIYVLAVYTGLRLGELLGIRREDIDLDRGILHVRHQVTEVRGRGLMITEPKTEKAKRPVTLPATALEVMESYLGVMDPEPGLIFTTSTGRPISPRNVTRHFKTVIKEIGLPEIRFHDLRHTHATLLLAAGVHPKIVQERLGHSQISLTLDTYSHVIPSLQTEAAEQFEAILG